MEKKVATRNIIKNAVGRRNYRFRSPLATSCFAALAKNSHLRTVFTALRAAASRRSVPTVTTFPRNDKLYGRVRCLITFIRFYPKRTPVPPCHCEERNARRGNLPEGKTYLRTRPPQILARGGSPPRNPPHQKRKQMHTVTRILARKGSLSCLRGLRAEKSPASETKTIVHDHPNTRPQGLPVLPARAPRRAGAPH